MSCAQQRHLIKLYNDIFAYMTFVVAVRFKLSSAYFPYLWTPQPWLNGNMLFSSRSSDRDSDRATERKKKKKRRHQDSDNDSELPHKRSKKESHKPKYNIKENKYDNGFHPGKHWRDGGKDHLLPSHHTLLPNGSTHHQFNGYMGKACHLGVKSSSVILKKLP